MAGLIGVGRNTLGQANVGFQQSANLEDSRNAMGDQLRQARAAQRASMVTTGAGLGGSIGVNNLMAANAAANTATIAAPIGATTIVPTVIPAALPSGGLVATGGAVGTSTGLGAGAATTAGMTTAGAAAGTAAGTTAATTAAAGGAAAGGAATGTMAAIGAIATPLLIGAGAALLLDSMFDIF
jgi:hypothetical protein